MKQKVIDILNNRSSEINQSEFTQWGVIEENFEMVAEEIVKLFAIPVVSQQRELLKAFYAYIDDKWALGMLTDKVDEVIKGFEKSI